MTNFDEQELFGNAKSLESVIVAKYPDALGKLMFTRPPVGKGLRINIPKSVERGLSKETAEKIKKDYKSFIL